MNVYQMYVENGNRAGFSIKRNSWNNGTFCVVEKVAGKSSGELDGTPPYYNNQKVRGVLYVGNQLLDPRHEVSCPGTYAYSRIPLNHSVFSV